MVQQNADRLARIAEEILDIARVKHQIIHASSSTIALDGTVAQVWHDWRDQDPARRRGQLHLGAQDIHVVFEPDHLRRVLVNLLDNALRYASRIPGAICVTTEAATSARPGLRVWSDGQPLEHSVQRHLFEPFFSSESRSSGLGLYICRELCERHGALIGYQRAERQRQDVPTPGNEFFVAFRADTTEQAAAPSFATIGS
jgi:two-component system sensor histidine kinase PilS (NtrC family)